MSKPKATRRNLRFSSLDDILADAQALFDAGIQTHGNWTAGQIIGHIALAMHGSVHGFPFTAPLPLRIIGRVVRNFPLNKGLPSGIKIPNKAFKAAVPPQDQPLEDALKKLTVAVKNAKEQQMNIRHPVFGKLSQAQWVQFHCRHAELHFSFLAPIQQPDTDAEGGRTTCITQAVSASA